MGLALYAALCIICIIYIDMNSRWYNWTDIIIIIMFCPFIVSIGGLVDIYDDIIWWYEESTE